MVSGRGLQTRSLRAGRSKGRDGPIHRLFSVFSQPPTVAWFRVHTSAVKSAFFCFTDLSIPPDSRSVRSKPFPCRAKQGPTQVINMATKRKLSVSDIPSLFQGKDRVRNTKYFHTMLTNPETPRENLELVDQYRMQHPEEFLTNEEIEANPYIFRKNTNRYRPRGYTNPYSGEEFDARGNPVGGFHDGGRDYNYGGGYRQKYYSNRKQYGGRKNDPSQTLTPSKVNSLMFGLKSDYARTRYMQKVCENPQSNPQTVENLMRFRDQHPQMFVDEGLADRMAVERLRSSQRYRPRGQYANTGYRRSVRDYDRDSWNEAWMPAEDYDSLPQNKKSLFTRFFVSRDRNRNSKLALRILSDPQSSQEDVSAVRDIVNERPKLFFKNPKPMQAPPTPAPKTTVKKPRTTKKS